LRTFAGHKGWVTSVVFSPDGARVISGSSDKTLKSWNTTTGQLLRTFGEHGQRVNSVAFSPDGTRVLSGSQDNSVKLWDAATGRLLRIFTGHTGWVSSVAFSPDGTQVLSGSWDATIKLWNASTGQLLRSLPPHDGGVLSVAFSPDGKRVLAGTLHELKLWEAATGRLLWTVGEAHSVAFSPDGTRVLSGSLMPGLRDAASGQLLRTFGQHPSGEVESVAWSPDGTRLLSANQDGTVKLWDAASGQLLRTFAGLSSSVVFSPDGARVLCGGADVKLLDATTGRLLRTFAGHTDWIRSVGFSRDGTRAVSGSDDATVRIWNAGTGELLATLFGSSNGEWMTVTPEGFFAASAHGAELLSVVRGLEITTIGQVHQSLFSPDLLRDKLTGDPDDEVKEAAQVLNLDKVVDSGPAPLVDITSHRFGSKSETDLVTVEGHIKDRGKGIGRVEWRVNGITAGVSNAPPGAGSDYQVKQTLALDRGENSIELVAYNARNLLASVPAQTTINYMARAEFVKPKLYVMAIGINAYDDKGWTPPGAAAAEYFPRLGLAVGDARSIAAELKKAGQGLYSEVHITIALDAEATAARLDEMVRAISAEINRRDTLVLFAAAHGYSINSRYLIRKITAGPIPRRFSHAISQTSGLDRQSHQSRRSSSCDACESGALTNSCLAYRRAGLEAAVGAT
jgi:WD40 repeat protein